MLYYYNCKQMCVCGEFNKWSSWNIPLTLFQRKCIQCRWLPSCLYHFSWFHRKSGYICNRKYNRIHLLLNLIWFEFVFRFNPTKEKTGQFEKNQHNHWNWRLKWYIKYFGFFITSQTVQKGSETLKLSNRILLRKLVK